MRPLLGHWRGLRRRQGRILPEELQELRSNNGFDLRAISADLDLAVAVEGVTKMPCAVEGQSLPVDFKPLALICFLSASSMSRGLTLGSTRP